ncbi:MAG: hypothetical protein HZC28_18620 [Spirochaetes bacterium]|nr:hypothetical protein [Spirochaetota bacterium]
MITFAAATLRTTVLAFIFVLAAVSAAELPIRTYKSNDNRYVSEGTVHFDRPYTNIRHYLTDFDRYNAWAFRGLSGDDQVSKNFVLLLKGLTYAAAANVFTVAYDVNLIWPFGSRQNTLVLGVTDSDTIRARSIRFALSTPSILVNEAVVILTMSPSGSGSDVHFYTIISVNSFFSLFFTMDTYKANVEWRIRRVIDNLVTYIKG